MIKLRVQTWYVILRYGEDPPCSLFIYVQAKPVTETLVKMTMWLLWKDWYTKRILFWSSSDSEYRLQWHCHCGQYGLYPPVEHHVEEVEGGGQPDDDEDDQAPVQLVLPPDWTEQRSAGWQQNNNWITSDGPQNLLLLLHVGFLLFLFTESTNLCPGPFPIRAAQERVYLAR